MKMDSPPFSKIYFTKTLPERFNFLKHKVDSREHVYHLPSLFGQTRAIHMPFLETVLHPVSITWQRKNVDSTQGCGPECCSFIVFEKKRSFYKHFMQFYVI
jgi:hypothetical protein